MSAPLSKSTSVSSVEETEAFWSDFHFPLQVGSEKSPIEKKIDDLDKKLSSSFEQPLSVSWESFSFPELPVVEVNPEDNEDAEEEDDGDSKGDAETVLAPPPPLEPEDIIVSHWDYNHEAGCLENKVLKKKIDLKNLDDVNKIHRLLVVCKDNPKMAFESLVRSLEKASWVVFDMELKDLMTCYPAGTTLLWKRTPKVIKKSEMGHP